MTTATRCAGCFVLIAVQVVSLKPEEKDTKMLASNPVPVVTVDGKLPGVSGLYINDELGGQMAAEHLIELGHRRVAFVGDLEDRIGFGPSMKRLAGYRKALANAGIEVPEAYVKMGAHEWPATLRHINDLLDLSQPPTAVVAAADFHAMVVAEGARACDVRVPDDLSVIGFDDLDMAEHLGLSTVRQPLYESGTRGARMLLDIMAADDPTPRHVELPLELVARGSTAPSPSSR